MSGEAKKAKKETEKRDCIAPILASIHWFSAILRIQILTKFQMISAHVLKTSILSQMQHLDCRLLKIILQTFFFMKLTVRAGSGDHEPNFSHRTRLLGYFL